MPRLILDVMGGDHTPLAQLEGAVQALPRIRSRLTLIGDEEIIRSTLEKRPFRAIAHGIESGKVDIVHATENIDMSDSIRSLRTKPNASINIGCRLAAEDWKNWKQGQLDYPSAFISAGHSGAMMASALLNMGRLAQVERPAIAVTLPTLRGNCVVLDVGAVVDCKPVHLRDFAIMGALYAQADFDLDILPRVGLLSNGEERSKGNELTRSAYELIERLPCFQAQESVPRVGRFIGYVEGKEIFKGAVDVVVTDGFVGNIMLKAVEGLGAAVVSLLKNEARRNPLTSLGFMISAAAFRRLKRKLDYAEYGAAPLLGVAGCAFICHGRSNARAIMNALFRAEATVRNRMVERLNEALEKGL